MVKLINTKLQYVSHFHVSVTQQVNFLRILLIVIFPVCQYGICQSCQSLSKDICENRPVGIVVYQPESAKLLQNGVIYSV